MNYHDIISAEQSCTDHRFFNLGAKIQIHNFMIFSRKINGLCQIVSTFFKRALLPTPSPKCVRIPRVLATKNSC